MNPTSDDFDELIREAHKKYAEGNTNHSIDCIEKAVHVTVKDATDPDRNVEQILDVVRTMMEANDDDAAAACLLNVNANLPIFSPEIQALVCMKSGECYLSSKSFEHALNKFEQSRKIIEGGAKVPLVMQAELALSRAEALRQAERAELAFVQLIAAYELYDQLEDLTAQAKIRSLLQQELNKIDPPKRCEFVSLAEKIAVLFA